MMEIKEDTDFSDDEVFFGRLSLKEVKKRILWDIHQKNVTPAGSDRENFNTNDYKIIETSSQPNILLSNHTDKIVREQLKSTSDPLFNRCKQHTQVKQLDPECEHQDSFLEMEKNITEHCISPSKSENQNLDNTLDIVDFILNHAQSQIKEKNCQVNKIVKQEGCYEKSIHCDDIPKNADLPLSIMNNKESFDQGRLETLILNSESLVTPIKCEQIKHTDHSKSNKVKPEIASALNTPIGDKRVVSNLFKTSKIPQTCRKETCLMKTPNRLKIYDHIASPIATYIKNSPQVPLIKDIHPKKPLPITSSIPKLVKSVPESKTGDKENVVLPQLAYRSAKKTTVIDISKEKLPQSQWAQKLTTTLRTPVVIKHNHRETGRKPIMTRQEDSFADLTLHQADVSVCTQKLAFNKV